jgi:hypothetical protein
MGLHPAAAHDPRVPGALARPLRMGMFWARARFELARHGWPMGLGLIVSGVAAGLVLFATPSLRERTHSLQLEQLAARSHALKASADPQELQRRQWADFYARLPAADGALEAVATIQRVATAHGVQLAHGEYRLSRDAGAPLMRYQITLPARSDYRRLRGWIGDVMNAVPSASLDEFSLRRDDAGSATVDARVRFTLYLRAP